MLHLRVTLYYTCVVNYLYHTLVWALKKEGGREDTTTIHASIKVTGRCNMTQTAAKTCSMMITTATLMQISSFTICIQPLPVSYPILRIIESGG